MSRSPKLLNATATPLASIFGSGFLVIVPILAGAVGPYSAWCIAAVCLVAYALGSVIRHNIQCAEPVLEAESNKLTATLDSASDVSLSIAYIISICLYLKILASFVLGGFGLDQPFNENLLSTSIIGFILIVGLIKGLKKLEVLEQVALYLTLFIVLLILAAFAHFDFTAMSDQSFRLPADPNHSPWKILTIVCGTLIVVQGFETTRYLGHLYDAQTRIRASRWSQIIATAVYIPFVALAMPLAAELHGKYNDNALVAMVTLASGLLTIPLIIAAALSQFSAAIADTIAAADNLEELTRERLKVKTCYLLIAALATALTWAANTHFIIALASRAFALYYLIQCLVAISVTPQRWRQIAFASLAVLLLFITLFAVPAA
ncbi:MAG: hypothetical protein KDK97_05455 [Verrucomicrobiales bacterium]|nr:hypothetical protein [Verrucomicrobiales bacterium]